MRGKKIVALLMSTVVMLASPLTMHAEQTLDVSAGEDSGSADTSFSATADMLGGGLTVLIPDEIVLTYNEEDGVFEKTAQVTGKGYIEVNKYLEVTVPTSITLETVVVNGDVGDYAFDSLYTITSVTVGGDVGDYAFSSCSGLQSVVIEDGVETIGDKAFYNCSKLVSVIIPTSVTTIGASAFKSCSNLAVTYQGTIEQWSAVSGVSTSNFATGVVVTCTDGSVTIE